MLGRLRGGLDETAAPRHHGHVDLLGELLGGHLVTERPDRDTVRADEDDASLLAPQREGGTLGHESPADPDRVNAGVDQCRDDAFLVEVGRLTAAVGRIHVGGRA